MLRLDDIVRIRSPLDIWETEPTLFAFEWITWLINICLFFHAKRNGKKYMMAYIINMVGGALLDPFCLLSPEINNYWHSQATIMLYYGREPIYQTPLITNVPYIAIALLWSLGIEKKTPILMPFAAGVLSIITWHIVDMVGIVMLWWTWHDSDPLYIQRSEGVPIGSTFWIFAWTLSVSFVCQWCQISFVQYQSFMSKLLYTLLLSWILVPFLMVVCFVCLYNPLTEVLNVPGKFVIIGLQIIIIVWYALCAVVTTDKSSPQLHSLLTFATMLHFISLVVIVGTYSPENVQQITYHQEWGTGAMCDEKEWFYWGSLQRNRYICTVDPYSHIRLCEHNMPKAGDRWYALCGVKTTMEWKTEVFIRALIGIVLHMYLRSKRTMTAVTKDD